MLIFLFIVFALFSISAVYILWPVIRLKPSSHGLIKPITTGVFGVALPALALYALIGAWPLLLFAAP